MVKTMFEQMKARRAAEAVALTEEMNEEKKCSCKDGDKDCECEKVATKEICPKCGMEKCICGEKEKTPEDKKKADVNEKCKCEEMDAEIVQMMEEEGIEVTEESYAAVMDAICEQGGGAHVGTAPQNNKGDRFADDGKDKSLTTGAAGKVDFTPSKKDYVEVGKKVSTAIDARARKFEEEEYEGEELTKEEVDALVEAAADWLAENGYEVDEESIEAVISDWAMEEEENFNNPSAEVTEGARARYYNSKGAWKRWGKNSNMESKARDLAEKSTGKTKEVATKIMNRHGEAADDIVRGDDAHKAMRKVERSPWNDEYSDNAIDVAPEVYKSYQRNQDKQWKRSQAKHEEAASWLEANGYEVDEESINLLLADMEAMEEESASEEATITEDVAELQCRLEECQGSTYMFEKLAEGNLDIVKRYLAIKEV